MRNSQKVTVIPVRADLLSWRYLQTCRNRCHKFILQFRSWDYWDEKTKNDSLMDWCLLQHYMSDARTMWYLVLKAANGSADSAGGLSALMKDFPPCLRSRGSSVLKYSLQTRWSAPENRLRSLQTSRPSESSKNKHTQPKWSNPSNIWERSPF